MPTAAKLEWIAALAEAGLREIEVGSFVSPKLLAQMADCADVVAGARHIDGLTVLALVPNLKGAERAFAAGVHKVSMPVSASRLHSKSNINMTPEQAVDQVAAVCRLRATEPQYKHIGVEAGLATAFGCTMEGPVSEDWVMQLAAMLVEAGADSVCLSDTTGYANPAQIKRMFKRLQTEIGDKCGGAHLHNTRGQGLANVVAALDAGVKTFDSSQGGLRGCPYAPGATGNLATEDLLYMLDGFGIDTGVSLAKALEASRFIEPKLGHPLASRYAAAMRGR
jgi:hydroxymethylglutaryl-CoA lyase